MVLVDCSQIFIANMMAESRGQGTTDVDLFRHMVVNSLRSIRVKFKNEGEMILCYDGGASWRKNIFKYYKANRQNKRDASPIDWDFIFKMFDEVRDEIAQNFPYRTIRIQGVEADDIIGTLVMNKPMMEGVVIVSGDTDFVQLQQYPNVRQWDHVKKKWITENNPEGYLKEHIIRGDVGDGIPNMLSDDDSLVNENKRQSRLTKGRFERLMEVDPSQYSNEEKRNWDRNQRLIDLEMIPEDIRQKVIESLDSPIIGDMQKVYKYFIDRRMRILMQSIQDFK